MTWWIIQGGLDDRRKDCILPEKSPLMQITVPLTGRAKIILLSCGVLLVAGAGFALFSLLKSPTEDEQRVRSLDNLVKMLEAYHAQHGFYPQPAAREETIDGVRHVWGYRPDTPSLASCTVLVKEAPQAPQGGETEGEAAPAVVPDATRSFCGGNVYDADGKVIGWKGTLALTSALNSVDSAIAGGGRLESPLSEITPQIPVDPAFALSPSLVKEGFGEFVYAVRIPEDGAQGKGGTQYQLAATIRDPLNGALRTSIRGNYFVRSDEQDVLPSSLIGPGILLDSNGNADEAGRPLHVLLDGQQQGFPNPLLGEGESILRLLTLRGKAERVKMEVENREAIVERLDQDASSTQKFAEQLMTLHSTLDALLAELPGSEKSGEGTTPPDIEALEKHFEGRTKDFEGAIEAFLQQKNVEVHLTLSAEVEKGEIMRTILSGALLRIQDAEDLTLLARDEVLKYLDGEGIEEQSRDRAGKRIESALNALPDLPALFSAEKLILPQPFLSEDVQGDMNSLLPQNVPETETGSIVTDTPRVMISTVVTELQVLLLELQDILEGIETDLGTPATKIEEIDASLRRLSRALATERARIGELFSHIASAEEAADILSQYSAALSSLPQNPNTASGVIAGNTVLTNEEVLNAIRVAATLSGEHGDFSGLLFSSASLDALVLSAQVGVPDISSYTDPLAAEYKGIPYPLP